jgi:hypothetical protein
MAAFTSSKAKSSRTLPAASASAIVGFRMSIKIGSAAASIRANQDSPSTLTVSPRAALRLVLPLQLIKIRHQLIPVKAVRCLIHRAHQHILAHDDIAVTIGRGYAILRDRAVG